MLFNRVNIRPLAFKHHLYCTLDWARSKAFRKIGSTTISSTAYDPSSYRSLMVTQLYSGPLQFYSSWLTFQLRHRQEPGVRVGSLLVQALPTSLLLPELDHQGRDVNSMEAFSNLLELVLVPVACIFCNT